MADGELEDVYGPADVPRDRYGRPMVVPPGAVKATAYTRCTTYVGVLEDTYNLSRWQQRMVALGLAKRPDLVLAAAAHHDDKDELNKICSSAMDAAAAGAAAGIGTALHKLTERLDLGEQLDVVPDAYQADIAAYVATTAPLKPVHVERFMVHDLLKVGGTPDLVVEYDGQLYIADKKTGSLEWGTGKIAMQLAMYSRSVLYDHVTKTRTPVDVNQDVGIVIHLPAGEGRCELKWVDLKQGWADVLLAGDVRTARSRKNHLRPFDPVEVVREVFPQTTDVTLLDQIVTASFVELKALYREHKTIWGPEHTAVATARKLHLALLDSIDEALSLDELKTLYVEYQHHGWTDEHTRAAKGRRTALHQRALKTAGASHG